MKKQNVIDLTAYREELQRQSPTHSAAPASNGLEISDELKIAIKDLIVKLRANDKT